MPFSDEQLAKRLMNMATDAHLSGDYVAHHWLSQAAARLLELSRHWHPSMQASQGVTITDVQIKLAHQYADLIDEILGGLDRMEARLDKGQTDGL